MALAAAVGLAPASAAADEGCGEFPAPGFDAPGHENEFVGSYRNRTYGFSIAIPNGLIGYGTPAPAPQHGVGFVLAWEPRACIFFDGSYALNDDFAAEVATQSRFIVQDAAAMLGLREAPAVLGNLRATSLIARHFCAGRDGVYVTHYVLARRAGTDITYTAALLTTANRYEAELATFEQLLASFRTHPTE